MYAERAQAATWPACARQLGSPCDGNSSLPFRLRSCRVESTIYIHIHTPTHYTQHTTHNTRPGQSDLLSRTASPGLASPSGSIVPPHRAPLYCALLPHVARPRQYSSSSSSAMRRSTNVRHATPVCRWARGGKRCPVGAAETPLPSPAASFCVNEERQRHRRSARRALPRDG